MNETKCLKVEFLLTRSCNLRCSYCKIINADSLKGQPLNKAQIFDGVRIINQMFPGVPIIFFGGEPTTLPWLPELVQFCEINKIKYAIISNSVKIMQDDEYFRKLVKAGISNWSVSIDTLKFDGADEIKDNVRKSYNGFEALKKFRDAGVRDLVACITVSRWNILEVPSIVKTLSENGIWSITTPLQDGDKYFEYSQPDSLENRCKDKTIIRKIASELKAMKDSGKYLMHNESAFYEAWDKYFISQDWKCSQKSALTIDADGSLKRCVDNKGGLEGFNILTLEQNVEEYKKAILGDFVCKGCIWDPAFETERRSFWHKDDAIRSFRHEMSEKQINNLLPECRKWFEKSDEKN